MIADAQQRNAENYPRKCFWKKEKETRVTRANRTLNNWVVV